MSTEQGAPSLRVATGVDAPTFEAAWIDAVVRASEAR
jgi:hypothetical protein